MDDEPLVSVIVCVLNAAASLRGQLDALSSQKDAPAFEVVIVDNGSTDASVEVVQHWMEEGIGPPVSARLVDASGIRGIAHARNTGVRHARGRLLAFCDADDVVDERWVSAVAASRLGREDGAIGGRVLTLGANGRPTGEVVLDSLDGVGTRAPGMDECPYFWGCNFAVSRGTYEAVGGFDESLPPYGCEDIEIGLRLAAGGHLLAYEPEMRVFYAWPTGRRRKFRRNVKAGTAMACVWKRHPEAFPQMTGVWRLTTRPVTAAFREFHSRRGSWRVRSGRAADEFATHLGYLLGELLWVRSGRLGCARLFEPRSSESSGTH